MCALTCARGEIKAFLAPTTHTPFPTSPLRDAVYVRAYMSALICACLYVRAAGEWEIRRGGKYALRYLLYLKYLFDEDAEDYNDLELEGMVPRACYATSGTDLAYREVEHCYPATGLLRGVRY
eukprot:61437-Rhodomonas_salina.1